ncbi:MAG: sulfotransferase [Woeseiaceae bacterium]|nr:sulfotransferase [Woeseiaceae bacterium]
MTETAKRRDAMDLIRLAWQSLGRQQPEPAVAACQELHHRFPENAEGWHVASHAAQAIRKLGKAVEFIDRALELDASNPVYRAQKASLLRLTGKLHEAVELARSLVGVEIPSASANNILGATLSHFDLHEEALAAFDAAIALNGEQPHYHFNRAAELRFLGRSDEAEEACNRVLALDPRNYECYLLRADLRKQTAERNHVAELQAVLNAGNVDWRSEAQLRFALAKEFEDLGDYERSFTERSRGAQLRRSNMQYDVREDIAIIDKIIAAFRPEHFRDAAPGFETDEPIFILGLPRTGTTLLERILDGHSDVASAGELNNFATEMMRLVHRQLGERAPANREELIDATVSMEFRELGKAYIDSTRPMTGQVPRFIDKLPLNYLYTGLIHRALPNARIIHMRRHPVAACYAVFKQPFRDAYPFSYALDDLAHYYLAYDRLMSHWRDCIPKDAMAEIWYEDLVVDTETEARRMIEFCGLEWQPACLEFHRRRAASTTASATQVRQPVYTTSLDMWRNYEQQLAPLIRILENGGIDIESTRPATGDAL